MPMAVESFDLRDFDVVISNSHSFAKGIITKPETLHINYCHTPTRYLWHQAFELEGFAKRKLGLFGRFKPYVLSYLRVWDRLASNRVDHFVANSKNVAKRIEKYYQRQSDIIYPPVNCSYFQPLEQRKIKDYYLIVSRLEPHKAVRLAVAVFNDNGIPLKIIGTGPEEGLLKAIAKPNIQFLGELSDEEIKDHYAQAQAFIFPQEEDFGITALEAQASGRPVIAYGKGGALETVIEGVTGTFFSEQTPECLKDTVKKFKPFNYNPITIRQHALNFDLSGFKEKWKDFTKKKWAEWQKTGPLPPES
jgi:glycosyltransferase involved in cell wall biosynthesis